MPGEQARCSRRRGDLPGGLRQSAGPILETHDDDLTFLDRGVARVLDGSGPAALADDLGAAGDVRRLVERHLAREEQLVLPVWIASFTADEHERFAGSLRRATPLRDAGLMISWLLDTAPDDAIEVAWSQVPPSLRLLHRVWWRRRYEQAFGACATRPATVSMPLGAPADA